MDQERKKECLEYLGNLIGDYIIRLLDLKEKPNGRVDTAWGDKTRLGLYLTLKRVIVTEDIESLPEL